MTSEFCPSCGNPRVGAFQFCRSCGYDFDALEPTASGPNTHQPAVTTLTSPPVAAAPSVTSPTTPAAATANLPLIGGLAWIACAALIGYLAYQQWVLGQAFDSGDFAANATWNLGSAAITLYFGVRLLRDPSREVLKRSAYWAVINVVWGVYQVAALDVASDIFVLSLIAAAVAGVVSWVARGQATTSAAAEPAVAVVPGPANWAANVPSKSDSRFGPAEIVIVIFIVLAIGGGAILLAKQNSDKILADVASLIPTVRPTGRVTAPPVGETGMIVGFDEVVPLVDGNQNDLGSVTVLDGSAPTELLGSGPTTGNRYVAAKVRYDAVQAWTYTLYDWAVHDGGQRQYEPLGYGPEPTLIGGTIAPGKNIEGWVAFEIPKGEDAWLDLQSSDGTVIFTVRLP